MASVPAVLLALCVCYIVYYSRAWRTRQKIVIATASTKSSNYNVRPKKAPLAKDIDATVDSHLPSRPSCNLHNVVSYKELFHQLHHPEEFPEALQSAENLLQSLLSLTISMADEDQTECSIMNLRQYSDASVSKYMLNMEKMVQDQYTAYVEKRKSGTPRDLFQTREQAGNWLKNISPIKLVDGAWLGNLRVTTAPFELQPVLRIAWQVLSEELGDGILAQNHVHVFQNLIRSTIPNFPTAESREFVNCHPDAGNAKAWRSALAQLTISLFPEKYVPEILGFNMHFELVSLETLKASTELKEVGLDPLYFLLHICIDNSDIGHTAMALQTVIKYITYVQKTEGELAMQKAWERVRAGFALSQYVDRITDQQATQHAIHPLLKSHASLEYQVIGIFRKKTQSARSVHCASPVRFKGLTIEQWLNPDHWDRPEWQSEFMEAFKNTKPWIIKGDRGRSRFMRELNWGGKMFGAFTASECEIIGQWIDSLTPETKLGQTIVLATVPAEVSPVSIAEALANSSQGPSLEHLLPLWFSAAGLLEGFCAIPAHTTNQYIMHILSTLRSQSGLGDTTYGAAPVEELPRRTTMSLGSIGLEMMQNAGFAPSKSVHTVLENMPAEFASTMMTLARSTNAHGDYLVGMALAFANLHEYMATSNLLSAATQTALLLMARSEIFHLEQCRNLLSIDHGRKSRFDQGYWHARVEIEHIFLTPKISTIVGVC